MKWALLNEWHRIDAYLTEMFTFIHHGGLKMFRLFKCPEVNLFAGQTLSIQSDGLDLDNIVCVFIQIPKYTSMTGCVHLTNETLHQPVLTLKHTCKDSEEATFIADIKCQTSSIVIMACKTASHCNNFVWPAVRWQSQLRSLPPEYSRTRWPNPPAGE